MSKPYRSINTKHTFRFFCFLAGAGITLILLAMMPTSYAFADGPTITGATDITVEATSTSGAMVTFSVAATDPVDGIIFPICTPPSGNLFALGTTTVTCTVTNSVASTTQATFGVGVVDTTPPYITPPADQTFLSTGMLTDPAGLVLATSTDAVDHNPSITYFPTSFAIGTTTVTWTATDAAGNMSTTTSNVGIVEAVMITIRNGATVVFSGAVALPASNAVPVDIAPTSTSSTVAVPARSLLSVLETLDTAQNEFAITDLQYFSSFDSFFINCITITDNTNPLCGSWQYAVNGTAPSVGTDHFVLENGDIVFLYFGSPRQVLLSTTAATVSIPFTATAQKYDPMNNTYVATTGVTIGVTQPDPDNPWNPIEIATSTVDVNGQAVFILNAVGTYGVGIKEDYYFPLTTLTVANPISSSGGASGGSAGSSGVSVFANINIQNAINFLASNQNPDGSIGSSILYSDWAAIALSAAGESQAKARLKNYLLGAGFNTDFGSRTADLERRAMALMSLGVSPYEGTQTDFIGRIVSAFDGTQIGDANIFNDDIFALFPLLKAGYSGSDEVVDKTLRFIISKQSANGSWDSVDLTAAAIQALTLAQRVGGLGVDLPSRVDSAGQAAKTFLRNSQDQNGGFGNNTISTAWAIQAINALGDSVPSWEKNGKNPLNFLASKQANDGGMEDASNNAGTRIWTTAFAIPAALGKTWEEILSGFSRPAVQTAPITNSQIETNNSTTTPETATSTLTILPNENATSSLVSRLPEQSATSTAELDLPVGKNGIQKISAPQTIPAAKTKIISSSAAGIEKPVENQKALASSPDTSRINETSKLKAQISAPLVVKNINADQAAKTIFYASGGGTIILGLYLGWKFLIKFLF